MQAKHCRHCNAKVPESRGWLDNYCCEDHRVAFQERQHKQTIERLRREEPDEQLESEFALHTFEPRRVRVSMLGGEPDADFGGRVFPEQGIEVPRPHISRQMPPPVNVQPLVAPPLQQKASVEQSLAALSFVAEPVSAPLEMPESQGLGASVRRVAPPAPPRRNEAIVNLIRGAKERINDADSDAPVALGVPSPKPEPSPAEPGKTPGHGARVRSIAVTRAPSQKPNEAGASPQPAPSKVTSTSTTSIPAAKPRTPSVRPSPAMNSFASAPTFSTPSFSALGGSSSAEESGAQRRIYGAVVGLMAVAGGICYFVYGS